MVRASFVVIGAAFFSSLAGAGCASSSGPADPPPPTGPRPAVQLSVAFGAPPLEGAVHLDPLDGSGWSYRVDVDEDGSYDHEGVLDRPIAFHYRFSMPGLYRVHIELTGEDVVRFELPVVVYAPGPLELLAVGQLPRDPPIDPASVSFEGLTVAPDGSGLYAADYLSGVVLAVDPVDPNRILARGESGYSIEGLSVAPSGDYLFAAFKYNHVARFRLPDLTADPFTEQVGLIVGATADFFVTALDDRRALFSGTGNLLILDVPATVLEARAMDDDGSPMYAWHHSVSSDGTTVAAIDQRSWDRVRLFSLPALVETRAIVMPADFTPVRLAFGPDPSVLYVLGHSEPLLSGPDQAGTARFLALDLGTGESIRDVRMDVPIGCHGLCVANPTARSTDGRWVVFEAGDGTAVFVDTANHSPMHVLPPAGWGAAVVASPVEPATFWLLSSDGTLRKVRVAP